MSLVVERDTVEVAGPDAARYLQGQLSNDVAGLAVGASVWSFLLEPTGKLGHLVRVRRVTEDGFVLDAEPGRAEDIEARLRRFLIRTKATVSTGRIRVDLDGDGAVSLVGWWGEGVHAITDADPSAEHAGEAERRRVEAGWPGADELEAGLIPGETGVVPVAASFTKGCYTGQELVARVDSRGNNVPFLLRRLVLSAPVAPGTVLESEGADVGRVTSVAGAAALGYVSRRVVPPGEVTAAGVVVSVEPQRSGDR